MAQAQAPASIQVPVMVKPLGKFKTGMNLTIFKVSFHQYCQRIQIGLAASTAVSLRDVHILNYKDISNFDMEIPSADDLAIFYQTALIVHRDKKAKKLTGATIFADDKQGRDGGDDDFNARNARVIDILQRKIDTQIEPAADGEARQQELKTIELIRTYLRNFKVLLPDEIQNMIKFLRLSADQRKTQQDNLRAEVISVFGDVVSGIETYENGIDAYIFVLQTIDGLYGSEVDLRNKILTHVQSWGITNTESAQNHFAVLEQLLKRGRKFGVEISTEELKRDTIATLMSGNQKLPMPIITIATNHRVVSTSTFEQMVLEFSQVSIQKMNDTDSELQSVTATKALQATNQASGSNHEKAAKFGKRSPHDLHHLGIAAQDRLQGQVRDSRAATGQRQSSEQWSNGTNPKFRKDGNYQGQQARTGRDSFHHGGVERRNFDSFRNSRGNEGQQAYPRRDNFSGDTRYNNRNQRNHYDSQRDGAAVMSRRDSGRQDFRRSDDQDRPRSGQDYRYGSARNIDRHQNFDRDRDQRYSSQSPGHQGGGPRRDADGYFNPHQRHQRRSSMAQHSRRSSQDFSEHEDMERRSVRFSNSPPPRADRHVIPSFSDQESESNFVASVRSLSFAGTMTVLNFGRHKIQDDIVQGDEIVCDKDDCRNKMDQAILSALQASWLEAEQNRSISYVIDECEAKLCQDNDQCNATSLPYNTIQTCQYECNFESFYTQSFGHLQQSIAEDDESANKNTMGEWLHYMILNFITSCSNRAGKITGMFLAAFTVPEIISQVHDFSNLTHLCNQALEALLESQPQEPKGDIVADNGNNVEDNFEQISGAVELTIPPSLPLQPHYLFTTVITVDRQAIYTLADILQASTFPTFTLIAPVWVQALHDQYCTVSSESFSDHCGTNLLQHVRKLLEVHNDCVHCESLPTISNVISYHSSRMQRLIIRPSRVFVVSVNLHRTSGEALLSEAHRLFPSFNRTDKIQFLKQYCDLRLLIDTEDLHPTYQRFKPIAQQSIENIFLCICNQQYPDVLRVSSKINIISTPTNNSHDSDFSSI
jgi:hypothetical protein